MINGKLILNNDYMLVELQPGDDVKICPYFYDAHDGGFHEDPDGGRIVLDREALKSLAMYAFATRRERRWEKEEELTPTETTPTS